MTNHTDNMKTLIIYTGAAIVCLIIFSLMIIADMALHKYTPFRHGIIGHSIVLALLCEWIGTKVKQIQKIKSE